MCKTGGWKIYTKVYNTKGKLENFTLAEMPIPENTDQVKFQYSTTDKNHPPILMADAIHHKTEAHQFKDSLSGAILRVDTVKAYWELNVRPFDPKKDIAPATTK